MEEQKLNNVAELGLARFFSRIYAYLGVGIAVSAVTSFLVANVYLHEVIEIMSKSPFSLMLLWVVQIGLALFLSARATKNPTMALALFVVYSGLIGITLGITIALYAAAAVYKAFIAASVTYGVMAVFGTRTQKNLSAWGQALRGGLIGIILVILINGIFLHSQPVELFISIVTVIVFAGLTAYDHQRIKAIYYQAGESEMAKGLAVYCALQLYLNFINLLLAFLRIFGRD